MPKTLHSRLNSTKISQPADRLHVDILEQKFGPITAKVLRHDYAVREAHLEDKNGISRTFAVSIFPHDYTLGELDIVSAKVRRGLAIGNALHEYGFSVRRNILLADVIEVPAWLKEAFHDESSLAKFRLSEFLVKKPYTKLCLYATVLEIFPAGFQKPEVLATDRALMNAPLYDLEKAGITDEKLWEVLGEGNDWGEMGSKIQEVREACVLHITKIFEQMRRILAQH